MVDRPEAHGCRDRVDAVFERPLVSYAALRSDHALGERQVARFRQLVPMGPGDGLYRGRTLMLIDERAISQAEHTGLAFKAAAGTILVGSPTAGANGDATALVLPGNIAVTFTGQAVLHPDGRQLQRVGPIPDIPVSPTIAGIRAGRDEVLERVIEVARGLGCCARSDATMT